MSSDTEEADVWVVDRARCTQAKGRREGIEIMFLACKMHRWYTSNKSLRVSSIKAAACKGNEWCKWFICSSWKHAPTNRSRRNLRGLALQPVSWDTKHYSAAEHAFDITFLRSHLISCLPISSHVYAIATWSSLPFDRLHHLMGPYYLCLSEKKKKKTSLLNKRPKQVLGYSSPRPTKFGSTLARMRISLDWLLLLLLLLLLADSWLAHLSISSVARALSPDTPARISQSAIQPVVPTLSAAARGEIKQNTWRASSLLDRAQSSVLLSLFFFSLLCVSWSCDMSIPATGANCFCQCIWKVSPHTSNKCHQEIIFITLFTPKTSAFMHFYCLPSSTCF